MIRSLFIQHEVQKVLAYQRDCSGLYFLIDLDSLVYFVLVLWHF
jgi:hypothetical protein